MNLRIALGFGLLALAACGGKTDDVVPTDAGHDEGVDAKPLPNPVCPSAVPQDGSSCSHEGVKCEYGSDPRWTCNTIAYCSSGRWSVGTTNDAWCPTPDPNPPSCPASFSTAQQGAACSDPGTPCQYSQGWCTCMWLGGPPIMDGGPEYTWECSYGTTSTGCPSARPRLGTPCNMPGTSCDYGVCDQPSGLSVQCDETTHTWTDGFGAPCAGANGN